MAEPTAVERIMVPFRGPGAGTAPLTWGQKAILRDMRETGWTHNSGSGHRLPPGTTVPRVAAILGSAMSIYPALRMRLGTDEHGRMRQEVSEAGEVALDVVTFPDDADPGEVEKYVDDYWYRRLLTHFDLYQDWSVYAAAISHRDTVYRVLSFTHITVDGGALVAIGPDLGFGAWPGPGPDPKTEQILDLARREQTPALRRVSDRSIAYWESRLRDIPPLTFGEPAYPHGRLGERFWHGRFDSPAAYLAMLAIAHRTGTDTSRVLFAIIAIAVARATGVNPLTTKVIVSNRFRPGMAEVVAPLSQNSVITLDVADATVDEVVARVRPLSVASAMTAYYDPDQLEEHSAQLDRERGYPARVSCRMNDRRHFMRPAAEEAARRGGVTRRQIEEKLGETFLSWDGTVDHLPEQAFITVEDRPDTITLQVIFDMASFTEEQVEALLRGVQEVAVEAAFDPAAHSRVGSGAASG